MVTVPIRPDLVGASSGYRTRLTGLLGPQFSALTGTRSLPFDRHTQAYYATLTWLVRQERVIEGGKVSKGLKYTFLAHGIVSFIFGAGFLFVPSQVGELIGWQVTDDAFARLMGAVILGVCISSWLAYRATEWGQVRIVVRMENFLPAFAALASLYSVLFEDAPSFAWVNVAIFALFAVSFAYYGRAPQAKTAVSGQTAKAV